MDGRQPPNDDRPAPSNSGNPNVFDDEYALERDSDNDFGFGVADGFRPGHDNGGAITGNSAALDHRASIRSSVRRSVSENFPPDAKTASAPLQPRNSIAKGGHAPRGSLTMANDGPNSSTPERSNTYSPAPRLVHRASIASTSSFATEHASQSGFGGSSGPSHPYGMYPQGTGLARSASVTTTSTRGPQRSYSTHGPTHPYGMYPQNGFEDPDEISPAPVQNTIPVGFPGLGEGYHRQIGPDGEEQDIIGPDGHMEQLPPYSRFPVEGPTKASLMAVPEEFGLVEAAGTGAATAAAAGAGNSQDTLLSSNNTGSQNQNAPTRQQTPPQQGQQQQQQQQQQQGGISPDSASTLVGSEDPGKAWGEKRWKEKGKTRILWGKVPVWVLVTAVIIIIILAVILGVVIGTFMTKEHIKDERKGKGTQSLFDASSIPIPTNLPALPLGTYALPIRSPDVSSNECITNSEQNDAWSCNVEGPPLEIKIGPLAKTYGMSLQPLRNTTSTNYGSQAPKMSFMPLNLVTDLDNPADGPAWHFQTVYDKIVILRPEEFAAGKNLKRHAHPSDYPPPPPPYPPPDFTMPQGFRHRNEIVAGDTPWFCIWNQTFIEAFVYVSQNTSAAASSALTAGSAPATTSPSPAPSYSRTPAPTSSFVSSTPTPVTSQAAVARRDDDDDDIQWYPRLVKIEERRMTTDKQPYCQKMQLLDDGRIVPITNSDGDPIIVDLSETDPDYENYKSGKGSKRVLSKREDPANACHCQWTFS